MSAAPDKIIDVDSYVPLVRIWRGTEEITDHLLDDIIELRVTLQKDELGGFTMQLANHFEVPDEATDTLSFRHSDDTLLDVFTPLIIEMGYSGRRSRMFVGEITMLQPAFPSSGVPTFSVTGTDMLGRLRRAKPGDNKSKSYHGRSDTEIAQEIAKRHQLKFSKDSTDSGAAIPHTNQKDQDDLKFLMGLAHRNSFECCVIIENKEAALYFGKPRDQTQDTVVDLTYGEDLISFTPKLRVGRQVAKVTVRGWDPKTKKELKYTAELKDLPKLGKGKTAIEKLQDAKAGAKEERIVDWPVQSQAEAKKLAIDLLLECANEYLTGSGETIGNPTIKPQVQLHLHGLGPRYSADNYYVTKTDHVFGASGYTTSFDIERMRVEDPKGKKK